MSRTAGFSAIVSVNERIANLYIQAYFASNIAPQPIPLPSSVTIAGIEVQLAGSVSLLPPEVAFAQNAANAIAVSAALVGTLTLSSSITTTQQVEVVLFTQLSLPLATQAEGTLWSPGVDFSQSSVASVGIDVLRMVQGDQPLEAIYTQTLDSGPVLDALTAGLQAFSPSGLPMGPLSLPLGILFTQLRSAPPQTSEFPPFPAWFSIDLALTRIVPVVLDGALTVGVNLNEYTATGDATQLVDLNTSFAPGPYILTKSSDGSSTWGAAPGGIRNSDLALLLSQDVLISIVQQQVSNVITGTLIDDHIEIRGIGVDSTGYFDAGIYGTGYGATLTASVAYDASTHRLDDGWGYCAPDASTARIGVDVTVHLQFYLSTLDGETGFTNQQPDVWASRVVDAQVSLPDWLEPALLFSGVVLPAIVLPPLAAFSAFTSLIIPSELQSALGTFNYDVTAGVNGLLSDASMLAQQIKPFPRTSGPAWLTTLGDMTLTEDGIDASIKFAPAAYPTMVLDGNPQVLGTDAYAWSVYNLDPIGVALQLPAGAYRSDDPSLFADWTVTRADTGAAILTVTQQLAAQGGASSISIDHASPELTAASQFSITCSFYRRLGYRIDAVYTGTATIKINDIFDRSHPYVLWTHVAYFANPGANFSHPQKGVPLYWSRLRQSVIHRTEVSARCLEMRRRGLYASGLSGYSYLDTLPEGASPTNSDPSGRQCAYCFYGGPDKEPKA